MQATARLLTGGVTLALAAGAAVALPATAATAASDRTGLAETSRVDRVPTPQLAWSSCYEYAECATAQLPLDYDLPRGTTTQIAVLRVKAKDQEHKIGSLFVNPGGPGGSGTALALAAPYFLSESVLERFDIVGFDPRGVEASQPVRCFQTVDQQAQALAGMQVAFPYTPDEEQAYVASAKALGMACSSTGRPLSGAMSTAEAARDMDVLRRAVGDAQLSYLGFSYGSALGQYYANMFPNRVRAIVVDGVINPVSWTGTLATRRIIQDDRLRSADGAYRALQEILTRCDEAGVLECPLAGQAAADFELVANRLKANPLGVVSEPKIIRYTYADFIGEVLYYLYDPDGAAQIVSLTDDLLTLTAQAGRATSQQRAAARQRLVQRAAGRSARTPGYDNSWEAMAGVACTDGLHPTDAALWPAMSAAADARAPYFGRAWAWTTAMCAAKTWTVRDDDAYVGPFNRYTSSPVLVVGNYWDPATNYNDAVSSAAMLPNSRLLSSDSWGHTAYGTSSCATGAIDSYLLDGTLPNIGTVCVGDTQPFTVTSAGRSVRPATSVEELAKTHPPASGELKQLPPVAVDAPLAVRAR